MSELVFADEDPDPLPPINGGTTDLEIGSVKKSNDASEWAGLERLSGIYDLCETADDLLQGAEPIRTSPVMCHAITSESGVLLSRLTTYNQMRIYNLVDTDNEGRYRCRSWRRGDELVTWCENEQRHEPAEEVMERLVLAFSVGEQRAIPQMGRKALRLFR